MSIELYIVAKQPMLIKLTAKKCLYHLLCAEVISFFATRKWQKKPRKTDETVNTERENLHNFWTAWGISMKFSGKIRLMIILKVEKETGLHPLYTKFIFRETTWGGIQTDTTSHFSVKLVSTFIRFQVWSCWKSWA